jgi:hypothetical protein
VGVVLFLPGVGFLLADQALSSLGQEDDFGPFGQKGFQPGEEGLEAKPVGEEEPGLGEGLGQGEGLGSKVWGSAPGGHHRRHPDPASPLTCAHQVGQDGRGGRHPHLGQGGDQEEQ